MVPRILPPDIVVRRRDDGVVYAGAGRALSTYPPRVTDCLDRWASERPSHAFLVERDRSNGEWRSLTYGDALIKVRRLAQALIDRRLSTERPVAVLSSNSVQHALLGLAAMYAGVPYIPIAPPYSLATSHFGTLQAIWASITPGLVFAAEGDPFAAALGAVATGDTEIVTSTGRLGPQRVTAFDDLESDDTGAVDDARAAVTASTIAKILFTSGSTGSPKGVINTQQMLCANQQQILDVLEFLGDEPPILCDWLPWNHTFGGNHNFGIVLYNGGTLYIDTGRPLPGGPFQTTVDNLRDVATTIYLNVPRGYELLAAALRADEALRSQFFSRVKVLFCAAAAVKPAVAQSMVTLAQMSRSDGIPWMTGLGATETAPFAFCTGPLAGVTTARIGVPCPGLELKAVPAGEFAEARVRGPNVTPGYWKDEELTRKSFDEEGYYKLGDLVRWANPDAPNEGFVFEGRLNENFKLSTGTWVRVGMLRQVLLSAFGDFAQDVAIAAPDRDELTALVFPAITRCRAVGGFADGRAVRDVLASASVRAIFAERLRTANREQIGTAGRIVRVALLTEPPSLDLGEITDKGSLNQRAVLRHRAAIVDELYGGVGHAIIVSAAGD